MKRKTPKKEENIESRSNWQVFPSKYFIVFTARPLLHSATNIIWVTWNIISTMECIKFIRFKLYLQSTTKVTEMAIKWNCLNMRKKKTIGIARNREKQEKEVDGGRRKKNQISHTINVPGNSKNVESKFSQKGLLLLCRFCLIGNSVFFFYHNELADLDPIINIRWTIKCLDLMIELFIRVQIVEEDRFLDCYIVSEVVS